MNIEQVIKKFYEGSTTREEEHYLIDFFQNEDPLDERWNEDKQLFHLLNNIQIKVPEEVSKQLEESIVQISSLRSVPRRQTWYYWIGSAAATVLLCIGLYFFISRESQNSRMVDTFNNPEEATMVAEQTLAFISAQLNYGMDKVDDTEQELKKLSQIINKYLN